MRIRIIGAVAAGTSAAAKAIRNAPNAQIVIYEKDGDISYSGCGMPYYIGGEIRRIEELLPRDATSFKAVYNVEVRTHHEVLGIDPSNKRIEVKNNETGDVFFDAYDKLVLATGASAVVPDIKGVRAANVFTLRTMADTRRLKAFIDSQNPQKAAVIGSGFVGMEACESLQRIGIKVTLIEKLPQITPQLDAHMAAYVQRHVLSNGVDVRTGADVFEITQDGVMLSGRQMVPADMVLVCTGVRPNTALARAAGIALGKEGAIRVDRSMRTNIPDIYACGDCAEQFHVVTGKPIYAPLGSTANKMGRITGDVITGGNFEFRGVLGTGIFRIFGMTVAHTGISENEAIALGYETAVCRHIKPSRAGYMGGREMTIKTVADKATGRLLGAQIVGFDGVDKRIDVFVTAITLGATAKDLVHLDLAYAPPFSTPKDPVMYTGMILESIINRGAR